MDNIEGIEGQFCSSWESWDEVDTFCLQFNEVELLPWIVDLVGHTRASCMAINCSDSTIQFYFPDATEQSFKFKVSLELDRSGLSC